MGMRIGTNVQSLVAQHQLHGMKEKLEQVQNREASGTRIIQAKDDAAGLAISENLRADLRSTTQNLKNIQDASFLLSTADSAFNEITNIVIRMKELSIQASSETYGDKERSYLNNEYDTLKEELNRISRSTLFNGRPLLNGNGEKITLQVGPANNPDVDRVSITTGYKVNSETLGLEELNISKTMGARDAIDPINNALDRLSKTRSSIGAGEARLSATIRSLMQYEENVSGAYSQIHDADLAFESAEYAKYNILNQASVAVLAQANNAPALALKLLS